MKSYIITLKGHELSERVSKECVTQAAKFNIDVTVFDAIWGKDYLEHLASTGLKLGRVKKSRMDLGHYGNFFSHYYIWQKCLELNEPLIILEHDGFFIRELPNDILDKFTDLLKLDCESPFDGEYSEKISKGLNSQIEYINSIEGIHKRKKTGWYTCGSYGYIIKPVGAEKLISWVTEHGFTSTDNQLGDSVLDISMCSPSIVRLHPLYEGKAAILKFSTTSEMGMPSNE
jgi:GR25 family glycosyltransferase involved in LPS biosynthesis